MFRVELPLLLLVGCASAGAAAGVVVDPPSDPDTLRAAWRYVGVKADPDAPTCPEPSPAAGWSTEPMFPGTDNRLLVATRFERELLVADGFAPERIEIVDEVGALEPVGEAVG